MSIELFFFPFFCFFGYFGLVDGCVVWIVSGRCNLSSTAFFYLIFESLYHAIDTICNADVSSSSFFSWHTKSLECTAWCIIKSFLVLCSICLSSTLVHFKNGPEYLTRRQLRRLSFLWDFCSIFWLWIVSSFSRDSLLKKNFLHLYLFDGVKCQYSQVFVRFLFSDLFLVC